MKRFVIAVLLFPCLFLCGMAAALSAEPTYPYEGGRPHPQAPEQASAVSLFKESKAGATLSAQQIPAFLEHPEKVLRMRPVSLNGDLFSEEGMKAGGRMQMELFPGLSFKATTGRVGIHDDGLRSLTAQLDGEAGYLVLAHDGQRSLGGIYVPALGLDYKLISDPEGLQHYLVEMQAGSWDELASGPPLIPDITKESLLEAEQIRQAVEKSGKGPQDEARIDILIAYTPAARQWADTHGGGMGNVLALSVAQSQLALDNSQTLITLRLVRSGEVSYTESGSASTDLIRFTSTLTYMREVHSWRNQSGADLCLLYAHLEDAGGIAWQLINRNGSPSYGFSVVRVQQAAFTYTPIHEMGHNMGCHHHADQLHSPGPTNWLNWSANKWSAGWRWEGQDGVKYSSVMSYTAATAFANGTPSLRVPYFSSPLISHEGKPTGETTRADNARTLREMKHVIAAYRVPEFPDVSTAPVSDIATTTAISGGTIHHEGSTPVRGRGVVWSSSPDPTLIRNDGLTTDGTGGGSFSSQLTGLQPSTQYFVRAYAINSTSITIGNEVSFYTGPFYRLRLESVPPGGGILSGAGNYPPGKSVAVSATPNTGYVFNRWALSNGELVSEQAAFNYDMPGRDIMLVARFDKKTYTINAGAGQGGRISPEGVVTVTHGDDQAFRLHPDEGHHLQSIRLNGQSINLENHASWDADTHTFTFFNVVQNHHIQADFARNAYTIHTEYTGQGRITPTGPVLVLHGDDQVFSALPDWGHHLSALSLDQEAIKLESDPHWDAAAHSYRLANVTKDHHLLATFEINTYTVHAAAGKQGLIEPAGEVEVRHGEDQVFSITPFMGHRIRDIAVDDSPLRLDLSQTERKEPYQHLLVNITSDRRIEAHFERLPTSTPPAMHIYPNPARDILWVDLHETENQRVQVVLYNRHGQAVRRHHMRGSGPFRLQMNVSGLAPGLYRLRAYDGHIQQATLLIMP